MAYIIIKSPPSPPTPSPAGDRRYGSGEGGHRGHGGRTDPDPPAGGDQGFGAGQAATPSKIS